EMEKDEGVLIDQHAVAICSNRVIRQVPGGEVGALVSQHGDALKAAGPVVEIFLIREAAVLVAVVTPLQAALAPPAQARQRMRVASEAHPSHVVDPVLLQALKTGW